MAKEYKQTLKGLSEKLKSEPIKTPIQEVRPVEPEAPAKPQVEVVNQASTKKEAHMNFWVPEGLMERLKIHSAINKKTIKQIGIEALEAYLSKQKK
ncbi:hypothetical protein [Spirosoma linguale]|uniref:Uncharacterized protein n=1 Tax=Spirosoma linguale (strain ATCC 33905 / DSM 74 / LMG 10896 / Claus 1) TaxID=504472 RepID=D2QVV8_SPILD|nr:hypothetical protein Slin_6997 [Spirosoma linguale DSM 74]